MDWSSALSPDVIAKLANYGYGNQGMVDLGNGYVVESQWTQGGGEGGTGPEFDGYSIYQKGQTNPGQAFAQYDPSGKFVSQQAFGNQGSWSDALIPLAAAATMGTALPALGIGAGLSAGAGAAGAAGVGSLTGAGTLESAAAYDAGLSGVGANAGADIAAGAGAAGVGGAAAAGGGSSLASQFGSAALKTLPQWAGPAAGLAASAMANRGGSGGGGGAPYYTPTGLAGADQRWQGSNAANYALAQGAQGMAQPAYNQSFQRAMGIDYQPFLDRANQSGAAYGQAGDLAMQQMGQYGQMAQGEQAQRDMLYGAAGNVLNTAFDPQEALYNRTQQRLTDQIRAGQSARGIAMSDSGAMDEAGALGNFNIDWQNAQLGRQATGIQAAGQATSAGATAGRMYGADQAAALGAGAAGAGYYGQAGQVPMQAQEYYAGAPGRAADALTAGYGGIATGYGGVQTAAIPYMNYGQGAQQQNYSNQYQNNRDMASGVSQFAQAAAPSVQSWLQGGWQPNAGSGTADWASGSGNYAQYNLPDYGVNF